MLLEHLPQPINGLAFITALARQQGFRCIFTPLGDVAEAALIPGLEVYPVESLAALVDHLSGRALMKTAMVQL